MRMKHEIRERWVEALRSGRYKKTSGALGRLDQDTGEEKFCAYGVLCELAVMDGVVVRSDDDAFRMRQVRFYYRSPRSGESSLTDPPKSVLDWAGIAATCSRVVDEDGNAYDVITLNDNYGKPFDEIAKLIDSDVDRRHDW